MTKTPQRRGRSHLRGGQNKNKGIGVENIRWSAVILTGVVLLALLSNAIKFTAPGTLLHLTLTRRGKWAYLRLTDGGEGMTPEVLASAFSRYAQPQEQSDPRAGAGFSLPVVQAVIQAHGGTILLLSLIHI